MRMARAAMVLAAVLAAGDVVPDVNIVPTDYATTKCAPASRRRRVRRPRVS